MSSPSQKSRSFVYVDMPNVVHGIPKGENPKALLLDLVRDIQSFAIPYTRLESFHMYVKSPDPFDARGVYDEFARALSKRGVTASITRDPRGKDIDPILVNDLWRNTAQFFSRCTDSELCTLRHVIVSGDGMFAQSWQDILATMDRPNINLEAYVYSWRRRLSGLWKGLADQRRYLDMFGLLARE